MLGLGSLSPTLSAAKRFEYVDTEDILNLRPEYNRAQKQMDLLTYDWKK